MDTATKRKSRSTRSRSDVCMSTPAMDDSDERTIEEILAAIRELISEDYDMADWEAGKLILRMRPGAPSSLSSGAFVSHRWGNC